MSVKQFNFVVASPCCKGAKVGYSLFHGYKIFHCMGCGHIIEKKMADIAIRGAKKVLSDAVSVVRRNMRNGD